MTRKLPTRIAYDVVTLDGTPIGSVHARTTQEAWQQVLDQADFFLAEAGYEDVNSLGLQEVKKGN